MFADVNETCDVFVPVQVLQRMRDSDDIEEEFEMIKQNYWDQEQEQLNKCTSSSVTSSATQRA